MEEQTNEALWYVVHTYSGYENKVANDLQTMVENRHLQDLICDIKVPTEMVPEIKDGKERMVEHKLFPGYVLVKMVMNDDTWYVVRNTRGCTGFVGPASKPVPLSAEEVEKMGVEKAAPLTVDFNVGDTVQITAGPPGLYNDGVSTALCAPFHVFSSSIRPVMLEKIPECHCRRRAGAVPRRGQYNGALHRFTQRNCNHPRYRVVLHRPLDHQGDPHALGHELQDTLRPIPRIGDPG